MPLRRQLQEIDPQNPPKQYFTHHTRNRQTFSNQKRLEVLAYLKNHVVYAPTMAPSKRGDWRPATIPEAAAFFNISHHTIRSWRRQQDKILAEAGLPTSEPPPTLTAETKTGGEDIPSVPETAQSSETTARNSETAAQSSEATTTENLEATTAQVPKTTAVQSYTLTTTTTPTLTPDSIPQRKRRGPMPKPLSEREPKRLKPVTQIQRTYNNRQRIEVLAYLQNHIVYAPTMGPAQRGDWRPPTIGEAADFFKISANTIKSWRKQQDKILAKAGLSGLEPPPGLATEPQPGSRDLPPVSDAAESSEMTTAQSSEATTAQNSTTTAAQSYEPTATPAPAPQRKRRGPKPKPLSERKPKRLTPVTHIQRTYNNRQRLQVLAYLQNHIVYAPTMGPAQRGDWRPPTIGEAADFFKISANTIKTWRKKQDKILAKAGIPTLKAKPQPASVAETAGTSETATKTTGQSSETTGQSSETTGQTFEKAGQSSQTTTAQSSTTAAAQVSETKTIITTP
ncbi:hypothetical protein E4U17_004805 [Claviceps sp. LM77 group G4]|nr:hypothetical protein E4U17_004805 [Claviceps sp. LM77 group G4]KAG6063831.1 hypothetical protein E4U33_006270 [Claviceps sp. LM78 group G4]KAG6074895.1 hypothetical protein E4U16_003700 [Claviceps sp. LM84 group G4]